MTPKPRLRVRVHRLPGTYSASLARSVHISNSKQSTLTEIVLSCAGLRNFSQDQQHASIIVVVPRAAGRGPEFFVKKQRIVFRSKAAGYLSLSAQEPITRGFKTRSCLELGSHLPALVYQMLGLHARTLLQLGIKKTEIFLLQNLKMNQKYVF